MWSVCAAGIDQTIGELFFRGASRPPRARLHRRELGTDQPYKSVAIDDGDAFAFNADPTLARELVERFGHRLPGAAETVRDALVRPTLFHGCARPSLAIGKQEIGDA